MAPSPRFELVGDPEIETTSQVAAPSTPPKAPAFNRVAIEMMGMALSALSQRALVALAACFNMLLVGSVFALWFVTPDPNPHQIASLGMYAVFALIAIYLNRRK